MSIITPKAAIESLRKVVAERGENYIYNTQARESRRAATRAEVELHPEHYDFTDPRFAFPGSDLTPEERKERYIHDSGNIVDCVYAEWPDGEPVGSCGVGRALELDFPEEFRSIAETEAAEGGDSFSIRDFSSPHLSYSAVRVYATFQEAQDQGKEYGEALRLAERVYEGVASDDLG